MDEQPPTVPSRTQAYPPVQSNKAQTAVELFLALTHVLVYKKALISDLEGILEKSNHFKSLTTDLTRYDQN